MDLVTIADLKRAAAVGRIEARVHAQVEGLTRKETKDGKPYWELIAVDAGGKITLRAWSDGPAFAVCEQLAVGVFVEVAGEFASSPAFGVDARRWSCRELSEEERAAVLGGSAETRARQAADYEHVRATMSGLGDPRLRALAALFLEEYGERFCRAAAARGNHHARRGGLVEHVAQMMRSAEAIAGAYPALHRDLLLAGVLFHDCGKLWENGLPADGFVMPFDELGEMLGHITIGIEVVNRLWHRLVAAPEAEKWRTLMPKSEDVRLHLLHLLAAHHGELQFGSPVVPKTPEAWALHYVDNLDAKMEMMAAAYANAKALAPRIRERAWPLPGNLVLPLARPASGD